MFDISDLSKTRISSLDNWKIGLATEESCSVQLKWENIWHQRCIDEAVSMYFGEYGKDDVVKILKECNVAV